jgi:hypothetical protein
MPTAEEIRKDAELVVDVCMSVEEDDVVTIICDNEHRTEAADLGRDADRVHRVTPPRAPDRGRSRGRLPSARG